MKKKNFLTAVLFILMFASLTVFAQDEVEPVDPERLLRVGDDEIFVRNMFLQDFSEDQGYVNEMPDPNTIHQYYIYKGMGTDMLMSMLPSENTVRMTNKRLTFDQSRKDEFHVTFTVKQAENIPAGRGGKCWIRFSNVILLGKGRESGLILYPGEKAYYFTPVEGEMTYEEAGDLSALDPGKKTRFDVIRLGGIVYVYANGNFQFSYEDGIKEAVSFEGGSELSMNGNRIRCDFDDFSMRTK